MTGRTQDLQIRGVPWIAAVFQIDDVMDVGGYPAAFAEWMVRELTLAGDAPAFRAVDAVSGTVDVAVLRSSVALAAAAICGGVRTGRVEAGTDRHDGF